MKYSKQLLTVAGVIPKLRLGDKTEKGIIPTGAHRVKVIEDRIIKGIDQQSGKEIEYVEYTLEEGGEQKLYKTRLKDKNGKLSYLVQRFAEIAEGDEVILEMKRAGLKNYIAVTPMRNTSTIEVEEDEHSDDDGLGTINVGDEAELD